MLMCTVDDKQGLFRLKSTIFKGKGGNLIIFSLNLLWKRCNSASLMSADEISEYKEAQACPIQN
jgi:hypothetical protein